MDNYKPIKLLVIIRGIKTPKCISNQVQFQNNKELLNHINFICTQLFITG